MSSDGLRTLCGDGELVNSGSSGCWFKCALCAPGSRGCCVDDLPGAPRCAPRSLGRTTRTMVSMGLFVSPRPGTSLPAFGLSGPETFHHEYEFMPGQCDAGCSLFGSTNDRCLSRIARGYAAPLPALCREGSAPVRFADDRSPEHQGRAGTYSVRLSGVSLPA